MSQKPESPINTVIGGNYKITSIIASGSWARVYKATDLRQPDRTVAVKMLHEHMTAKPEFVLRFQQEAEVLSLLHHEAIVHTIDFGISESSQPYLVTPFIEGIPLDQRIAKGPMPPEEALDIVKKCCVPLHYAHQKGVIHRDLKPSNIMLCRGEHGESKVNILDFGLAKMLNPEGESLINLTVSGLTIGTPRYMSPEQCLGRKLDGRADLYGLACILYEMLCGKPPVQGESALICMTAHLKETPRPFADFDPPLQVPSHIEAAIFKALNKDPNDRFADVLEFSQALTVRPSAPPPPSRSPLALLFGSVFKTGKPDR